MSQKDSTEIHRKKIQFYSCAIGSLTETQNQLLIARDVGYLTTDAFHAAARQSVTVSKLINGLKNGAMNRQKG